MIEFKRYCLDNGLRVLVHEDKSTPLVALNILYIVGSRDEDPGMTGMAHLFEHLMFGGSKNIPDYDTPLQLAGGENNAYTNNDITNYYLTIPSGNIETGFWLESDRMLCLDFSKRNLDIQKKVVIEEFKQRYLNQPYGDIMLRLRPLAYKEHPYKWPAIGKDISDIEKVTLKSIKDFFFSHYAPNNAIFSITGNIKPSDALMLTEKWFGTIEKREIDKRNLPVEPPQTEERSITIEKDVPADALYKAWHVCPRVSPDFFTLDLLTDIFAGGESGRLYSSLVREKKLFSDINAYITGDIDPGLLIINGKIMKGIDIKVAEEAVIQIVDETRNNRIQPNEMDKVKNKFESSVVLLNTSILNKAMSLSLHELIGDANGLNEEVELYRSINSEMVIEAARNYLKPTICSTLYYKSKKENQE
jgi:predicted Zn-dependent peptidase